MSELPKKKFKVTFEFETIPYNKDTYDLLGPHFFEEWPDNVFAKEDIGQLFQDAIVHRLSMSLKLMAKKSEEQQERLEKISDRYAALYEQMRNSVKIES